MNDYSEWEKEISDEPWHPTPRCEKPDVWWRTCDNDEGHEDYQHECRHCKKSWWVDGADA